MFVLTKCQQDASQDRKNIFGTPRLTYGLTCAFAFYELTEYHLLQHAIMNNQCVFLSCNIYNACYYSILISFFRGYWKMYQIS